MEEEIFSAIITISLIMIALSMVVIIAVVNYKKRQEIYLREKKLLHKEYKQQLMQSQIEVQEFTFTALSEELHDNIGQLLSSSKLLLNVAKRDFPVVPDALNIAEETLGKAIQDLRALSKTLNKEWLNQFNVIENLEVERDRINSSRAIIVHLESSTRFLPLPAEAQVVLFRIIQEALQNSIKHASPQKIVIKIDCSENIHVLIEDDGKGFDIETTQHKSVGLRNMKHRTDLLGGTIEWKSKFGHGTEVSIHLPVHQQNI